jgi:hypothetical protein
VFGTKFWDQLASGVAERWVEQLLSPAILFWAGGFLAYVAAHDQGPLLAFLSRLDTPLQIALAAGGLVIVSGSAAALQGVQQDILRLLEGYWPRWLRRYRDDMVARIKERNTKLHATLSELSARYEELTVDELETYAGLDATLATYPTRDRLLPTRLGNRLRAAEDYAWHPTGSPRGLSGPVFGELSYFNMISGHTLLLSGILGIRELEERKYAFRFMLQGP